jgi:hypothetical protein
VETPDHDVVGQVVVHGQEKHPLVVAHVGANKVRVMIARVRVAEVDRVIEAERTFGS